MMSSTRARLAEIAALYRDRHENAMVVRWTPWRRPALSVSYHIFLAFLASVGPLMYLGMVAYAPNVPRIALNYTFMFNMMFVTAFLMPLALLVWAPPPPREGLAGDLFLSDMTPREVVFGAAWWGVRTMLFALGFQLAWITAAGAHVFIIMPPIPGFRGFDTLAHLTMTILFAVPVAAHVIRRWLLQDRSRWTIMVTCPAIALLYFGAFSQLGRTGPFGRGLGLRDELFVLLAVTTLRLVTGPQLAAATRHAGLVYLRRADPELTAGTDWRLDPRGIEFSIRGSLRAFGGWPAGAALCLGLAFALIAAYGTPMIANSWRFAPLAWDPGAGGMGLSALVLVLALLAVGVWERRRATTAGDPFERAVGAMLFATGVIVAMLPLNPGGPFLALLVAWLVGLAAMHEPKAARALRRPLVALAVVLAATLVGLACVHVLSGHLPQRIRNSGHVHIVTFLEFLLVALTWCVAVLAAHGLPALIQALYERRVAARGGPTA